MSTGQSWTYNTFLVGSSESDAVVPTYSSLIGEETPTSASWRGIAFSPFFLLIS